MADPLYLDMAPNPPPAVKPRPTVTPRPTVAPRHGATPQPAAPVVKQYVAKFDVEPRSDSELAAREGDLFEVIDSALDEWWLCRVYGDVESPGAWLPADALEEVTQDDVYDVVRDIGGDEEPDDEAPQDDYQLFNEWYFPNVSKQDTEAMLYHPANDEGAFLVRDSLQRQGQYTLCIKALGVEDSFGNQTYKMKLFKVLCDEQTGRYSINSAANFASLQELIAHYVEHQELSVPLGKPCARGLLLSETEVDKVKQSRKPSYESVVFNPAGSPVIDNAVPLRLNSRPWYFGSLSRREARLRLLKARSGDGTFLIRDSDSKTHPYTLCVRSNFDVLHYRIDKKDGRYTIWDTPTFANIDDLVHHYSSTPGLLRCLLTDPCPNHLVTAPPCTDRDSGSSTGGPGGFEAGVPRELRALQLLVVEYAALGRPDMADPLADMAYRELQTLLGPNNPEGASIDMLRALMRWHEGSHEEADRLLASACSVWAATTGLRLSQHKPLAMCQLKGLDLREQDTISLCRKSVDDVTHWTNALSDLLTRRDSTVSVDSQAVDDDEEEDGQRDSCITAETTSATDTSVMSKEEKRLLNIVTELVNTEKEFVKRLDLLQQLKARFKDLMVSQETVNVIFRNVENILDLHKTHLLPDLTARLQTWKTNPRLCDIFKQKAPFLKVYTDYVKGFDSANAAVENLAKKANSEIGKLINKLPDDPKFLHLTMQAILVVPVQRVPRYELLLNEYIKNLPEDSIDKADSQKALQLIKDSAIHIDKSRATETQFGKLLELANKIDGCEVMKTGRTFIQQRAVRVVNPRTGHTTDMQQFLFSDLLVLTTTRFGSHVTQYQFILANSKMVDGTTPNLYTVFLRQRDTAEISFGTKPELDKWKEQVSARICAQTALVDQRKTVVDPSWVPPDTDRGAALGREPPILQKFPQAAECSLCQEKFSFLFRKYHCRCCGKVVCLRCSVHRMELPYHPDSLRRTCDECKIRLEDIPLTDTKLHSPTVSAVVERDHLDISEDNGETWQRRFCAVLNTGRLYYLLPPQDVEMFQLSGCDVKTQEGESAGTRGPYVRLQQGGDSLLLSFSGNHRATWSAMQAYFKWTKSLQYDWEMANNP